MQREFNVSELPCVFPPDARAGGEVIDHVNRVLISSRVPSVVRARGFYAQRLCAEFTGAQLSRLATRQGLHCRRFWPAARLGRRSVPEINVYRGARRGPLRVLYVRFTRSVTGLTAWSPRVRFDSVRRLVNGQNRLRLRLVVALCTDAISL
jgi:hypothetical protein